MKDGNLLKEKIEYYAESFRTRQGLTDFFIGTAIWGFIIVRYTSKILETVNSILSFIPSGVFREYVSYLVFGIFGSILGIIISTVIIYFFKLVNNRK